MKYSQWEKYEIIRLVEASSLGARRTLKQIKVSKSTFYEWYRRYLDEGIEGLNDRSRCPNRFWNRIPDSERKLIVEHALEHPALSCREVAVNITDEKGYFVSESSVYRILKAAGLVVSPVFAVQSAKDGFQQPTTHINELWQTDFTYFKRTGWGWYYLSTVMDDYSRMILAWKLCSSMSADDVKETLDRAIAFTGVDNAEVVQHTRLLSDNGPCYISKSLQDYLKANCMGHTRGRPFHPMTQGKIERYHRSMKNIILLDNYYLPMELEARIEQWVEYYNNERYHESLGNITPRDKYLGKEEEILLARRKIKKETMEKRRKAYKDQLLRTGVSEAMPVS
jgi:putative transposase